MLTDDDRELRAWTESGKAPAGSCPFCASRISMVQRDGFFRARCSHRGCGATGPKMRSITRAADLFCCPPQRTAGGSAIAARPSTGTVGELLATDGAIEFFRAPDWHQIEARVERGRVRFYARWRHERATNWSPWKLTDTRCHLHRATARLVPASEVDADPATRGPL